MIHQITYFIQGQSNITPGRSSITTRLSCRLKYLKIIFVN